MDEVKSCVDGLPDDAGKIGALLQKIHDKYIKQVDDLFVEKKNTTV